jgi:hypothetical protein
MRVKPTLIYWRGNEMIDDSMIPESMPKADEYNAAAVVAVTEALGSGNIALTKALETMINFTGGLVQIIEKVIEEGE